jgi:D-proline reductase (dithiol) PrdB
VSLVARHLEANGIPTVIFGCAKDIVEHCGVPRLVFTDFPLGNPMGRPYDVEMQRTILGLGLDLLETARAPRTTVQAPFAWDDEGLWKEKVLTQEQPFVKGAAHDEWMEAKANYRELKAQGKA